MKAAVYFQYGSPEVLEIKQVERPAPTDNEILVRILATAVNSGDVRLRRADPFAVRFMLGLTKPGINILGGVFAGRVEATGKNVTKFKVGDEVFGSTDMKFGAYAEFKCFPQDGTVALKPDNVSFAEAAVIPFGGTTALHFLKQAGIKKGQQVLVYGASGAVGTAAIQLAKHFGAKVTGVCSTANVDMVKALGADTVIDYTKENFESRNETYDIIYDTVNKIPVPAGLQKLNENGVLILGSADLSGMLSGSFRTMSGSKKAIYGVTKQTQQDIKFLAELVKAGQLKPVIDKTYPLEQIAAAHAYVDGGHKKGNVAITI